MRIAPTGPTENCAYADECWRRRASSPQRRRGTADRVNNNMGKRAMSLATWSNLGADEQARTASIVLGIPSALALTALALYFFI
jgi:hypothetical protein